MNHLALFTIVALCLGAIFAAPPPPPPGNRLLQQNLDGPNNNRIQERSQYGYQPDGYNIGLGLNNAHQFGYPGSYGYGLGLNSGHLNNYGFNAGHGYQTPYSGLGGISYQGPYGGGYAGVNVPGINSFGHSSYSGIQGGGHGLSHKVPHYRSQNDNLDDNSFILREDISEMVPPMNQGRSAYEPYYGGYGTGYGSYGYGQVVSSYPNAHLNNVMPLLVSCQPNLIQGHLQSIGSHGYSHGYGGSAYRESDFMDKERDLSSQKEDSLKSVGMGQEQSLKDQKKETPDRGQNFSKN